MTLQELLDTTHYAGVDGEHWDRPTDATQEDGRPWWDTPDTSADPDDDEEAALDQTSSGSS